MDAPPTHRLRKVATAPEPEAWIQKGRERLNLVRPASDVDFNRLPLNLSQPASVLDLIGQANADPEEAPTVFDGPDLDAHPSSGRPLQRPPSLYDLVTPQKSDEDSVKCAIKAKARSLVMASFLVSACNTMSSILYVPAALSATGSAKGASLLLASLHSFCAMLDIFVAPSFGALTDTIGRKGPLVCLSGLLCLSRWLMLHRQNKRFLTVSRVVGYFSASLFSNTLVASILDITHGHPELGTVYRAMDSSAKGWGVVVGPWLAGLVAKRSLGPGLLSSTKLPYLLSGGFAALGCSWISLSVDESLAIEKRKPFKPKAKNILGFLELLGHGPQMNRIVVMSIMADVGARTAPIFAVTTKAMFGWDTETTARWLLCYGLGMAIGPGLLSKEKVRQFGLRGAHVVDNIGMVLAAAMLAASRKGKLFWSALLVYVYSLGFGPTGRSIQMDIATQLIPNVGKGELTGRFSSLGSISNMFSPQLFAWVFAFCTSEKSPVYYPGAPFAVAAFTNFLYGVLLTGVSKELVPW